MSFQPALFSFLTFPHLQHNVCSQRSLLLVTILTVLVTSFILTDHNALVNARPARRPSEFSVGVLDRRGNRNTTSALLLPEGYSTAVAGDPAQRIEGGQIPLEALLSEEDPAFVTSSTSTSTGTPVVPNPDYPDCPLTCLPHWIGDGWCDTECALPACGNDANDCADWCAPDCKPSWIGDTYCDIDCFRPECKYDGGDCDANYTRAQISHPLPTHADFDYSKCPSECDRKKLNNKVCEAECNSLECNFDGEDCHHQCAPQCANVWLGDGDCDEACNVASCGFDKGDCGNCAPGCERGMAGNGVCDKKCNTEACNWDAGDCWDVCWYGDVDYSIEPFFYPHCRKDWRGDGHCDCFCDNADCDFDYGDCVGYDCGAEYKRLEVLREKFNATKSQQVPSLEIKPRPGLRSVIE